MNEKKLNCFISYSHMDKAMCKKFLTHFKNISRFIDIEHWYDGKIPPGGEIDREIKQALASSDVVFLLISPDFISSYYCYEKELDIAIKRHKEGRCLVIPVILRDFTRGDYAFSNLKYVPTDGKAIQQFKPQNQGYVDAFTGIVNLLKEFNQRVFANESKELPVTKRNNKTYNETNKDIPSSDMKISYEIIKNGKLTNEVLTSDVFFQVSNLGQKLSHFIKDMNKLMEESIELLKHDMKETKKMPVQYGNNLYSNSLMKFLFQMSGYLQKHFVGYVDTCIHLRAKKGDVYADYVGIGYNNFGLSTRPIQAHDGMISCAIRNQMPVIKSKNKILHKKTHPDEVIGRDYITFAFLELSSLYDIDLSMCISIVGAKIPKVKSAKLIAMSILRFDHLVEKYIMQYIGYCEKIDHNYNVAAIFKKRGG